MQRLFIGISLPDLLRERLAALRGGLKEARWVGPETYHVTLRFLGEIDEDVAADVDSALITIDAPAVPITLRGLGRFGSSDKLRTLYAGVTPSPELLLLHGRIEAACRRAGLAPETRHYHPHITLARFRRVTDPRAEEMIAANADWTGGMFVADHFTLFRSHLSQSGAWYQELASYPLGGQSSLDGGPLPKAY